MRVERWGCRILDGAISDAWGPLPFGALPWALLTAGVGSVASASASSILSPSRPSTLHHTLQEEPGVSVSGLRRRRGHGCSGWRVGGSLSLVTLIDLHGSFKLSTLTEEADNSREQMNCFSLALEYISLMFFLFPHPNRCIFFICFG